MCILFHTVTTNKELISETIEDIFHISVLADMRTTDDFIKYTR